GDEKLWREAVESGSRERQAREGQVVVFRRDHSVIHVANASRQACCRIGGVNDGILGDRDRAPLGVGAAFARRVQDQIDVEPNVLEEVSLNGEEAGFDRDLNGALLAELLEQALK